MISTLIGLAARRIIFLLTLTLLQGCVHRQPEIFGRLLNVLPPSTATTGERAAHSKESVEARPRPSRSVQAALETQDPILAATLLELAMSPGPAAHRRVAQRYRELQILDAAYDHFARACRLDPSDAAAYEGLARIWRDWGFPDLGVGDATRAVYHAPSSAAAHNTLGTLLAAMGLRREARQAYQRALALEPRAAYALNNLCYLSLLEGHLSNAIVECQAALQIDSDLRAARNNLALAHAATGHEELARREFFASGDVAAGLYNMGILHLARKRYSSAIDAFDAASRERGTWIAARERAMQARGLATTADRRSE